MASFRFTNGLHKRVGLTIEPWAQYDIIPALAFVEFEFPDAPPPDLEFRIEESGDIFIAVNTEHLIIRINGGVRDFGTGERFPALPPGVRW